MIITLTKLRSQRCLAQDLGRIFYQSCVRKDLESFSLVGVINVLATPRTSTRVRHVTTACALCARIREFQGKKDLSEKKLTRHFVDHRNVKMIAGAGGKGACTFHSEPRKEWGGPDGGNGGNGGNVIIKGRNVGGMDPESEKWANILWDYLQMHQPLEKSDVIIGLGCHDLRVAERSAALFLDGWAPCLLFTGYLGNQTAGVWTRPEAEVFLDVAVRMGVPRSQILLETEATNTGENICLSYRVLRDNHIPASRVILVQQPFMERRVLATFLRQWPEQGQQTHAVVTSPQMVLSEYPHPTVGTAANLISYMLGALERIRDYPHKGFQVEQAVTPCALSAYNWFLEAGYQPK